MVEKRLNEVKGGRRDIVVCYSNPRKKKFILDTIHNGHPKKYSCKILVVATGRGTPRIVSPKVNPKFYLKFYDLRKK
jgi:hypothetical protein